MLSFRSKSSLLSRSPPEKHTNGTITTNTAASHKTPAAAKRLSMTKTLAIQFNRWTRSSKGGGTAGEEDVRSDTATIGSIGTGTGSFFADLSLELGKNEKPFVLARHQDSSYFFQEVTRSWTLFRSLFPKRDLAERLNGPDFADGDVQRVDADETQTFRAMFGHVDVVLPHDAYTYCINNKRYTVWLEDDGVTLRSAVCPPLVPAGVHGEANDRMDSGRDLTFSTFCVAPLASNVHWDLWRPGCVTKAEERLLHVFDFHQVELIRWFIGNGLCDPIAQPRILYIQGDNAVDCKIATDTLLAMIKTIVFHLSSVHDPLPGHLMDECARARFLFVDNADLSQLASDDGSVLASLTMPPKKEVVDSEVNCASASAILSSDKKWDKSANHLMQPWFLSRVITVTAKLRRGPKVAVNPLGGSVPVLVPVPKIKWTQQDIAKFANNCLVSRLQSGEEPPLTVQDGLAVVLGQDYHEFIERIVFTHRATEVECYEASDILADETGIPRSTLTTRLAHISTSFIGMYLGSSTIRGIAPRPLSPRSSDDAADERMETSSTEAVERHLQLLRQEINIIDYAHVSQEHHRRPRIRLSYGSLIFAVHDVEDGSDDENDGDDEGDGDGGSGSGSGSRAVGDYEVVCCRYDGQEGGGGSGGGAGAGGDSDDSYDDFAVEAESDDEDADESFHLANDGSEVVSGSAVAG